MNRFKLITGVLLVFIVGAFTGVIGAGYYYKERVKELEIGPPRDARIRMLLDRFSRDLNLSDVQRAEIEKILSDVQEKIFELRRKTFPEIEKLNDKSLEMIKAKLDSKQRKKFEIFQNKMKKFHDRLAVRLDFPGEPPEPKINEMKDRLNLTPDQVLKIKKIMEDGFQKRKKIMEQQKREQPPDFSKIRQEMMENENSQQKRIEEVLTTGQLKVFNKYLKQRRFRRPPGPPPDHQAPPPRW